MYEVKERDWKLFRKKMPIWQEKYMERLNQEYGELLIEPGKSSAEKFWTLEKRIRKDKRDTGVIAEMSRSKMHRNILNLIEEKAITVEDLCDFSEEFQEEIKFIISRW